MSTNSRKHVSHISIFLLGIMLTIAVFAKPAKIQECRLQNGLKILLQEDHRAPVAAIQVWYKVGARNEYDGITGISHVLEHMMSKGTPQYPKGLFSRLIAANGGIKNATTAADFTYYYTEITPDKINLVFKLEANRMRNLIFKSNELARELHVVMEERRLRTDDNPIGTLKERLRAAAFLSSPYHHPVVGWPQDIKHLEVADLQHWYQQWYTPTNATVVVVGDINVQQTCQLAKQTFGKLIANPPPRLKSPKEISALGRKTIIVHFPAKNASIILAYPVDSLKTAQQPRTAFALLVMAKLLSGEKGILNQHLNREQHLISSIDIEYVLYSAIENLFTFTLTTASGNSEEKIYYQLTKEIENLKKYPVSEQDLARAKKRLITEQLFNQDNLAFRAREIGRLATVGLPEALIDDFEKNITAVTAQDVQAAAQQYFRETHATRAFLKPITETF